MGQVLAAYPFENPIVKMTLTGDQVLRVLEHGATFDYGIAQVSGIHMTVDRSRPKGDRVRDVAINGSPLMKDRRYTVATSDYLANGGDAFAVFAEADDIRSANAFCTEAIIGWIRRQQRIGAEPTDRIRVLQPVSGR